MGKTRNLRDGVLTIKDGAGSPNSLVVVLDEGDLQFEVVRNAIQVMDRGVLDHVRQGDEEAVAVSFTAKLDRFSVAATNPTIYNALTKTGAAAGWTSVGATHEPFMVKLEFKTTDPASGGTDHETINFNRFFAEKVSVKEGDEYNTISVEGFAHITAPTIT